MHSSIIELYIRSRLFSSCFVYINPLEGKSSKSLPSGFCLFLVIVLQLCILVTLSNKCIIAFTVHIPPSSRFACRFTADKEFAVCYIIQIEIQNYSSKWIARLISGQKAPEKGFWLCATIEFSTVASLCFRSRYNVHGSVPALPCCV